MGRQTTSAPRQDGRQLRSGSRPPRRRFLLIAVGLSIAFHLAAAFLIVFLRRALPHEARPQEQGTVELLMVEAKGAQPSPAGQPQKSQPAPPRPEKKVDAPKQEAQKPETPVIASQPVPPVTQDADEKAPPPTQETPPREAGANQRPDPQPPMTRPAPPKAQEAPVFDLAGTESESNAEVLGGRVVPASPDNRFRNRPPIYPYEAAIHGEHGSVLLMIHVSEAGVATGVDVVESSGVASLDEAAATAVRKWRFRPALQEGRSVPFDMPFRFVFEAD
jgi:periplasmic protein TonB